MAKEKTPTKKQNDKPTETEEVTIERHTTVSEYSNEREIDLSKDDLSKSVIMPTGKVSSLIKLLEHLNELNEEDVKKIFTEKQGQVSRSNIESIGTGIESDTYYDTINNEEFVNDIQYGDTNLNMRGISVKHQGVMSGNVAVTKFAANMGIGETKHVGLWHSGIWVTIRPPKDTDVMNLEIALASNQIKLGRDTNTLIYSNYSVVFNRMVADFIVSHIIDTSVKLPDDVDLKELIKVQDFYILIAAMVSTIYPEGYPIIRNCKNSLVIEDDVPKCTFSVTGDVNPMKLQRTSKKTLTAGNLLHMSKKRPNSVDIKEVTEYQNSLSCNQETSFDIVASNGNKTIVTIQSPSLASYIDNGEEWIESIIKKSEELVADSDTDEEKDKKLRDTLSAVVLGVYNIYVTKLTAEDGSTVVDRVTINEVIDLLSGDEAILTTYIKEIREYINKKVISIIATANYICPTCKEEQKDKGETGTFKEFLPINVIEHFFDLVALRTSMMRERSIY